MSRIKFCHVIDASTANPLLFNSIKFSNREIFEYTVITLASVGSLQKQLDEIGVESFSLDHTSRKQAFSSFMKLRRYFRATGTQIVQTHLMDASIIGLAAAKLAGVPVRIFSGHHSAETALSNRRLLTFADGFSPRFMSNHTIAPSIMMKEIFVRKFKVPEAKVEVINHGFDLAELRSISRIPTSIRDEFSLNGKTIFLSAGRLNWIKDLTTMVEGFAKALSSFDDLVLLIAGDGDQATLRQLIKYKRLNEKVFLLGPRQDLPAIMKECDVFIHSSLAESFGMVFVEAFAIGKPIICTPTGIAPEIVKEGVNGFFFEIGNASSLADSIRKIMGCRDKWLDMGKSG